jgi:epidermal growth factor receptor substrate 15
LCDTDESGKLSIDQFALAMWFVEQKQKGNDPPSVLKPNMIPPSLRQGGAAPILANIEPVEVKPTYSNPELEMMAKEIDELSREKRVLEVDVAQKEADIRIKTGEIRSLQVSGSNFMGVRQSLI